MLMSRKPSKIAQSIRNAHFVGPTWVEDAKALISGGCLSGTRRYRTSDAGRDKRSDGIRKFHAKKVN